MEITYSLYAQSDSPCFPAGQSFWTSILLPYWQQCLRFVGKGMLLIFFQIKTAKGSLFQNHLSKKSESQLTQMLK